MYTDRRIIQSDWKPRSSDNCKRLDIQDGASKRYHFSRSLLLGSLPFLTCPVGGPDYARILLQCAKLMYCQLCDSFVTRYMMRRDHGLTDQCILIIMLSHHHHVIITDMGSTLLSLPISHATKHPDNILTFAHIKRSES